MKPLSKTNIQRLFIRLLKQPGTPESIARGSAIGLLVGFAVPFSLQMVVAFPLSLLFKASKVQSLLLTWVSNPLTIPFIYPFQCYVGSWLIGHPLSFGMLRASSADLIETPTLNKLLGFGAEVVGSFFAGGLLFGSIAGLCGYFLTIRLVRKYRERRRRHHQPASPVVPKNGNLI